MRFREVPGNDWPSESAWRFAVRIGATLALLGYLGGILLVAVEVL